MALELRAQGRIAGIVRLSTAANHSSIDSQLPDIVVDAIETALTLVVADHGLGRPLTACMSLHHVQTELEACPLIDASSGHPAAVAQFKRELSQITASRDTAARLDDLRRFFSSAEARVEVPVTIDSNSELYRSLLDRLQGLLEPCLQNLSVPAYGTGRTVLHEACAVLRGGIGSAVLGALLSACEHSVDRASSPRVASLLTASHETALHLLCRGFGRGISAGVFEQLVAAHPPALWVRDAGGSTPLELLLRDSYADPAVVHYLLGKLLDSVCPVDHASDAAMNAEAAATSREASTAWVQLLATAESSAGYRRTRESVRSCIRARTAHIIALAYAAHQGDGRRAIDVATGDVRKALRAALFIGGRFELLQDALVHRSETSLVRFARDHVTTPPTRVALKFMRGAEEFRREVDGRSGWAATPQLGVTAAGAFVTEPAAASVAETASSAASHDFPALHLIASVDEATLAGASGRKEPSYRYMVVMPAADRSLADIIANERDSKEDTAKLAKAVAGDLARGLSQLHAAGVIHGDVKPRNVVRVGTRYHLIDMDASASIGKPLSAKLSSAYVAPEIARALLERSRVRAAYSELSDDVIAAQAPLPTASAALDSWALGATLFQLLTGRALFAADSSDNLADAATPGTAAASLAELAAWDDPKKHEMLLFIPNTLARQMVSLLLCKKPELRHLPARILRHGFIAGKATASERSGTDEPEYDVFLSYRVATEGPVKDEAGNLLSHRVAELHAALSARDVKLKVWRDVKLQESAGLEWRTEFCRALCKSRVFVPLISAGAVHGLPALTADSFCDNVLLEHRLAHELKAQGLLHCIAPVYFGAFDPATREYAKFSAWPTFPNNDAVQQVENALAGQLEVLGLGAPVFEGPAASPKAMFDACGTHQGVVEAGSAESVLSKMADIIATAVANARKAESAITISTADIDRCIASLQSHSLPALQTLVRLQSHVADAIAKAQAGDVEPAKELCAPLELAAFPVVSPAALAGDSPAEPSSVTSPA